MNYRRIGKGGSSYKGKGGAGIVFTDGRSVLLLKRSDGKGWCLPGGKIEPGETPIDAAKRESKEECGNLEGTRFDSFEEIDGAFKWISYFYAIRKPFDCHLNEEHTDYKWVPLSDVSKMDLLPQLKKHWASYQARINQRFGMGFKEWVGKIKSVD